MVHCFRKFLVTFAENSVTPFDDISTGTPKVTKIRRKALHSSFELDSFVPNFILCCSVQPESLYVATKNKIRYKLHKWYKLCRSIGAKLVLVMHK